MGIKFLAGYVRKSPEVAESWDGAYKLRNTRLVIDGGGLLYLFLENGDPGDARCGGQYADYYARACTFFGVFERYRVRPLVVFDGVSSTLKEDNLLDRCQERLKKLETISESPTGRSSYSPPPLWARTILLEALIDCQVSFVRTDGEADETIAALGYHWRCPILTGDSDFFVCDLPGGVINFDRDFHPCTSPKKVLFRRALFLAALSKLPRLSSHSEDSIGALLELAGALAGNDFVSHSDVQSLYSQKGKASHPLVESLIWMLDKLQVHTKAEAMEKFRELLPVPILDGIHHSLEMYILHPDVSSQRALSYLSVEHLQSSFSMDAGKVDESDQLTTHLPGWLMERYHLGLLPPLSVLASLQAPCVIAACIESFDHGASSVVNRPLRALSYALLSVDGGSVPELVRVAGSSKAQIEKCAPCRTIPGYEGYVPLVGNVSSIDIDERRKLLLLALHSHTESVNHIPVTFQLVVASLRYLWSRMKDSDCRNQPPILARHLKVLLVSLVIGCPDAVHSELPCFDTDCTVESLKKVLSHWSDTDAGADADPEPPAPGYARLSRGSYYHGRVDSKVVHIFNVWQRIIRLSQILNCLLKEPFPPLRLRYLYDGVRCYTMYSDRTLDDVFKAAPHRHLGVLQQLWFATTAELIGFSESQPPSSSKRVI